ncbi:MAG: PDZ domain-containing protein [Pleurocapsa sp. MO_226.B13]|nr:PDZ domain-containing protein [Pleurocapsa sp. MO_226.B13]
MLTLNPDIARQINRESNADISIPEIEGVLIVSVMPDSPAMIAGLPRGDVITAIDGTAIADAERLQDLIDGSQIGRVMKIDLHRGEQTKKLSVIPQEIESLTTNY